ncbi:ribonuclease P protein component [Patescibacteria group bacterium]|nr:ribonuclease P protein component [Patescibacteria group bacterium]
MLPKVYRLRKNKDFTKVSKEGDKFFLKSFGIKWIKNELEHSRFGVVVSLKVDKKAVIRNKIKRMFRSIIREDLSKIKSGFDFLILTRQGIKDLTYAEVKNNFLNILKKKKLIND